MAVNMLAGAITGLGWRQDGPARVLGPNNTECDTDCWLTYLQQIYSIYQLIIIIIRAITIAELTIRYRSKPYSRTLNSGGHERNVIKIQRYCLSAVPQNI